MTYIYNKENQASILSYTCQYFILKGFKYVSVKGNLYFIVLEDNGVMSVLV